MLWLQRCLNKPLCPFIVCVQKMTHDLHVAPVVRLVSAKRPATEDLRVSVVDREFSSPLVHSLLQEAHWRRL